MDSEDEDDDQDEQKRLDKERLDKEGKRAIDKNIERSKCDGCDQTKIMSYRRYY